MKWRILVLTIFGLVMTAAFGQSVDSVRYAKQFSGATVGEKVTAAMAACNSSTTVQCYIVLDPSLASYASGSIPSMCAHCHLVDWRVNVPWTATTTPFPVNVTDAPYNAVCDGATDDTAAFQSALDANGAIQIPSTAVFTCKVTNLHFSKPYSSINCNGSTIQSDTTGTLFDSTGAVIAQAKFCTTELGAASGKPVTFDLDGIGVFVGEGLSDFTDAPIEHIGLLNNTGNPGGTALATLNIRNSYVYGEVDIECHNCQVHTENSYWLNLVSTVQTFDGQSAGHFTSVNDVFANLTVEHQAETSLTNAGVSHNLVLSATGNTFGNVNVVGTVTGFPQVGLLCVNNSCNGTTPITLANNSTATTQAANDNSTKVATTAYADRAGSTGGGAVTCNGNGCYRTDAAGYIHAWGKSSLISGTPVQDVVTITYPVTFTVAPDPVVSAVSDAAGGGASCTGGKCPAVCHVVKTTESTTGASAGMGVAVAIGGSGFTTLSAGDYCSWMADGK